MDMSASYKPVMLLAILDCADEHGRARLADVVGNSGHFTRLARKLDCSSKREMRAHWQNFGCLDGPEVQRVMLDMPFEKFERRRYLRYDRDLAFLRFEPSLWRQFKTDDLRKLRAICEDSINRYYERLNES